MKVTRINGLSCEALVTFKKPGHQINTVWKCAWHEDFRLKNLQVIDYESVNSPLLLRDITESVIGNTEAYHDQLLRSTDHWWLRLPRDFGLDAAANHGLALGDVNGDGLEDLYLCQQGGLPNRLFLQNSDGTLRDFSEESKTNYLDYCAAALLVDLDNDGDKDLVISQDFKILFLDNLDGKGHFELAFGSSTKSQSFSLSAADFDQDGKLDVYICGSNPDALARSWNGVIDDVAIWNRPLTDPEITGISNDSRSIGRQLGIGLTLPPRITGLTVAANGDITLTWDSKDAAGVTYGVFYSSDLSLPLNQWIESTDEFATEGTSTSYTIPNSESGGPEKAFFIVVEN